MKFSRLAGLLLLILLGALLGCSTNSSSSSSGTGALFVTTQGDTKISAFSIDLGTGKITANGSGVATGTTPSVLVMTPSGNAAFVANSASDDISAYTVNSDGTLTLVSGTTPAGTTPVAMAIDSASHLFVVNQGSDDILAFSISGTTLSLVGGAATGAGPTAVAVTPDGKYLYVANSLDNTVSAYQIDSSGALIPLAGVPYPTGTTPSALAAVSPTATPHGDFLYVANSGSKNISAFAICDTASPNCLVPDGTLTPLTDSPFSADSGPASIAVDPTGQFLYVADQLANRISAYKISIVTGSLTATSPATVSTGASPIWVAVHPGGKFLYVANRDSASISCFNISSTSGVLGVVEQPVSTGGQPSAIGLK